MRLTGPSGSARRRAREWEKAERTRLEGEQIARQRNELRQRQKLESQAQARLDLATYEPWGRAGGGAPNLDGNRFTDIRAKGIYPEDELRGVQFDSSRHWGSSPLRRRKLRQTPLRIREDPQCYFAENLRKSVDNDIRYRQSPAQQKCYKDILDEMVKTRQKALHEEMRRNLEFEQKMGWTDQAIFDKMSGERPRQHRSSLALPQVKRDDDPYADYSHDKENVHFADMPEKLPDISHRNTPTDIKKQLEEYDKLRKQMKPSSVPKGKGKRSPKDFSRRFDDGGEVKLAYPEDLYEQQPKPEGPLKRSDQKTMPEDNIMHVTGGIELVPLLARRRRVGARTLPSSDVTRPPDQSCQWREMIDAEYLAILKHQMRAKSQQQEESRQNSAESVRRHHETWASLWGRPGHGAPQQRGRYARSNLARLLYVTPLAHHRKDPYL